MPASAPSERCSSRGVSPAVGVSLPTVVVVLLAAMVGMMVMEFGDTLSESQPQVSFGVDYHPDDVDNGANGAYINVTHELSSFEGDSRVFVVDDANNRIAWKNVWTGGETVGPAGEYAHIDSAGPNSALKSICEVGQCYRVIIEHENGSSSILASYEIPAEPISKSATY